MTKGHYKGTFNWQGEVMVLYGWFKNEITAFLSFITRIAKNLELPRRTVLYYFGDQTRDGYLIEKVKK